MSLEIGKLRHRLTLKSPTQTQGGTGEVVISYSTDSTVWGSLRPLTGKEIESSNQVVGEINYRAVIRYNSSIETEWRIEHNSVTYEIVSIMNYDELNEYQLLDLKRVV